MDDISFADNKAGHRFELLRGGTVAASSSGPSASFMASYLARHPEVR